MSYKHELLSVCSALTGCNEMFRVRPGQGCTGTFARSATGGVLDSPNIAIDIEPPPSLAHKLADFVQAICATAPYLVARHEFHRRVICPSLFMTPHFQPQPSAAWCTSQSKRIRTCAAMPRGQQIFFATKGICGVARTHQRFCSWGSFAVIQVAPTTVGVSFCLIATVDAAGATWERRGKRAGFHSH